MPRSKLRLVRDAARMFSGLLLFVPSAATAFSPNTGHASFRLGVVQF